MRHFPIFPIFPDNGPPFRGREFAQPALSLEIPERTEVAREYKPHIVTANDLFEGDTVYFTVGCGWTRNHGDAIVAWSQDAAEKLLAAANAQQDRIASPYLAETVMGADNRPQPVHFRESFRTHCPSNRFHGK